MGGLLDRLQINWILQMLSVTYESDGLVEKENEISNADISMSVARNDYFERNLTNRIIEFNKVIEPGRNQKVGRTTKYKVKETQRVLEPMIHKNSIDLSEQ